MSLKDTVSKSIRALVIDTDPAWKVLHDSQGDDRDEAWAEIKRLHDHNTNVDKLAERIEKDFYDPMKERMISIEKHANDVVGYLENVHNMFRSFCHHEDCEDSDSCPGGHTGEADDYGQYECDCVSEMNLLTPFYWVAAQECEEIASDIRDGILNNEDSPFAMIFALSKSIYRYETIYALSGMQTYHDQHDDSYDERGLKEFYALRDGDMYSIKVRMDSLKSELTDIMLELKNYAEAWKLKKFKK